MNNITFYNACPGCKKYGVNYCVSSLDEESDYKFYCFLCIPDGQYDIKRMESCICCPNSGAFAKIDESRYCLDHFLDKFSSRIFNIDLTSIIKPVRLVYDLDKFSYVEE
jgi:hypothetical protein